MRQLQFNVINDTGNLRNEPNKRLMVNMKIISLFNLTHHMSQESGNGCFWQLAVTLNTIQQAPTIVTNRQVTDHQWLNYIHTFQLDT